MTAECYECMHLVSPDAETCPSCGAPKPASLPLDRSGPPSVSGWDPSFSGWDSNSYSYHVALLLDRRPSDRWALLWNATIKGEWGSLQDLEGIELAGRRILFAVKSGAGAKNRIEKIRALVDRVGSASYISDEDQLTINDVERRLAEAFKSDDR